MAVQQTSCLGAVLTVVFKSVVAPVLVHVLTDDHEAEKGPGELKPATKVHVAAYEPALSHPRPVVEERVVAQGVGRTPDEAWYDAIANAVSLAVSSLVTQQVWAQHRAFICQSVLKESGGLISHCQDLGLTQAGTFWRRDVAVFVSRTALADRLRTTGVPVTEYAVF